MPLSMKLTVSQKLVKTGVSVTALLMFHFAFALPYRPNTTTAMTPLTPTAETSQGHIAYGVARRKEEISASESTRQQLSCRVIHL